MRVLTRQARLTGLSMWRCAAKLERRLSPLGMDKRRAAAELVLAFTALFYLLG
jgi:hypothetical protein